MGTYDTQQVCLNGHQVTDSYFGLPQHRRNHCRECGAPTTHQCPTCQANIKGHYSVDGVFTAWSTKVPKFCESCGNKFPWAEKLLEQASPVLKLEPVESLKRICTRLPLVVRQLRARHDGRETIDVSDEYDVQDILHALLYLFFDDVRAEEYTPSYAGKSTRMDFLLRGESIVIEAKMTRKGLGAKEIGEQLIVDIAHYQKHPNCKSLICLVYDPEHRVVNPRGLEADLSEPREGLSVHVFIVN
ncbi:MAG TPA: DUF2321 domain-containing protein [Arenimonas sp.]|uniref:DUF2321 domain-containing protein n=1 Tax=Arenimonas sp. TaxID=1872635 RepID=UPI002D7F479F|nr:DUF2321 domain-containing protein [Arenimonas sp.]HEU0154416.1 DUF2321 domain-containing protein [Arenimonas sp.]